MLLTVDSARRTMRRSFKYEVCWGCANIDKHPLCIASGCSPVTNIKLKCDKFGEKLADGKSAIYASGNYFNSPLST